MPIAPLTANDILASRTGSASDVASTNALHPDQTNGTQAGKTVVLVVQHSAALNTPTGFVVDLAAASDTANRISYFRKQSASAGETSWTLAFTSGTGAIQWRMVELDRVTGVLAAWSNAQTGANALLAHRVSAGSGANLTSTNALWLTVYGFRTTKATSSFASLALTPHVNFANGYYYWHTAADLRWATAGTSNYLAHFGHGGQYPYGLAQSRSATLTGDAGMDASDSWQSAQVGYVGVETTSSDPITFHTGFEGGTHGGLTAAPTAALRIASSTAGTWGTNFLVQAASARSGNYGLRIVQSGAAAYVRWDTGKIGTGRTSLVAGFGVRVISATGTVVLAEISPAAGTIAQLVYDSATSQLGMRWGSGGAVSWQYGTTPLNTWAWIDWLVTGVGGATWSIRWAVQDSGRVSEQEPPADLTGQTASTIASINVGGNLAQTVTLDADDVCLAAGNPYEWPLGRHKIVPLGVDPAGTVNFIESDDSANWRVFTANGTLGAWNATNARNAVDDIPPTISAAADGIAQVTASAVHIDIPGLEYTPLAGEFPRARTVLAALWSNGTGTITLDVGSGGEYVLTTATAFTPGNAAQPVSATVPMWVCGHLDTSVVPLWLAGETSSFVMGGATDATPDAAVHCFLHELAVREAVVVRLLSAEGAFTVDATLHSTHAGVEQFSVTTPAGSRGATLHWVKNGVAFSEPVAANATETIPVGALDWDDVTSVRLVPDPAV